MKALLIATVLAALPLGGCCLSLGGCDVPLAAARTDWDGLLREENPPPSAPTKKISGRMKSQSEQTIDDYAGPPAGGSWKDYEARQKLDDARLKQKLIICDGCAVSRN
jgi:hypothetical protein